MCIRDSIISLLAEPEYCLLASAFIAGVVASEIIEALCDIHAVRDRRREYCLVRAAATPTVCNVEQVIDCVSGRHLTKVSRIRRVTPAATDVRANSVYVSVPFCYDESNRPANAVIVECDVIAAVTAVERSASTVPDIVVGVADPVAPATQVGTRGVS